MKNINSCISSGILKTTGLSKDAVIIEHFKKWIDNNASRSKISKIDVKDNKLHIQGSIIINNNVKIINIPVDIEYLSGSFNCTNCTELTIISHAPKNLKNFYCCYCNILTSIDDGPINVYGDFNIMQCKNLKSLPNTLKTVDTFYYSHNFNDKTIKNQCIVKDKIVYNKYTYF